MKYDSDVRQFLQLHCIVALLFVLQELLQCWQFVCSSLKIVLIYFAENSFSVVMNDQTSVVPVVPRTVQVTCPEGAFIFSCISSVHIG